MIWITFDFFALSWSTPVIIHNNTEFLNRFLNEPYDGEFQIEYILVVYVEQ